MTGEKADKGNKGFGGSMADIRSYMREKEKREQKQAGYKEKIRKHKLVSVYRVLLVAAAAGSACPKHPLWLPGTEGNGRLVLSQWQALLFCFHVYR